MLIRVVDCTPWLCRRDTNNLGPGGQSQNGLDILVPVGGTERRTVLVVRETEWDDALAISTRRLAGGFADRGHNVQWVNPPAPMRGMPPVAIEVSPEVVTVAPCTPLPWSPRLPVGSGLPLAAAWSTALPRLNRLGRPDVLWLSHPKSVGIERCHPGVPVIWHVTDFYPQKSSYPERIDEVLGIGLRGADRVVASSKPLSDHLREHYGLPPERMRVIGHAATAIQLAATRADGVDPWDDGTDRPRVVYVGTLSEAEPDHLRTLADCDDIRLILIGEASRLAADIIEHPGVEALGPKPPDELARLLPWGDIGLISYRDPTGDRHRLTTPMKSYDYGAAGLVLVSHPMVALDHLEPPRLTHNGDDLLEIIDTAMGRRSELGAAAHTWALTNTWNDRTDEAIALIDEVCS